MHKTFEDFVGNTPRVKPKRLPGIRKSAQACLPKISDFRRIDRLIELGRQEAEEMSWRLPSEEGLFAGISSSVFPA